VTLAPVLFFHSVDAENLNAQSNNVKEILARWDSVHLPAVAFYFHAPDLRVKRNKNVRLIKLPRNRLWKARALLAGLRSYSGVVYPGFSAGLDNQVRYCRKILNRGGAVISTVEGLLADVNRIAVDNERLSAIAGHSVYGQPVSAADLACVEDVRSQSDMIICISPFLQKIASNLWPKPMFKNIPLGVNLELFHSRGRIPHGTNKRVQVVCAGNFQPTKRPEVFLFLARQHPEADFTWYGDGELRAKLLEQIQLESLHNALLPGRVKPTDLAGVFRAADIFVLPSVAEGVPKVTQEAAACGLPVVCMNFYEPFSVEHGRNGFRAEDDTALFKGVSHLIEDASSRRRMGAHSEMMAHRWSWDTLALRWQTAICEAAQRCQGS
jgi:glycosyltransferase involved in cell wall biosynthesis